MITIDLLQNGKSKILIVDDSEMNRAILADMLGDEYEIIEAENGVQAVQSLEMYGTELALILLDIVMPEMDGFGVLAEMNRKRWIENIPVIMISSESGASQIERAYQLGVSDFISRPFNALIVHHRVVNTILLYAKQKKLVGIVAEQIYEKEQQSALMIDILSHIVEFRNGESGLHVRHVHVLTELLLKQLMQYGKYQFSRSEIAIITTASALHDIGKIAIPEAVLNKPGKLTPKEFEIMKTHSLIGAQMLKDLPIHQGEPLVKVAYEICRWHHERYDGRGYPDGLKGDDIPISAQVVALADVYDALTSDRVYKKAISHDEAIHMILDGQCGAFSPLLLQCLTDLAGTLPEELKHSVSPSTSQQDLQNITEEMLQQDKLSVSSRTLQLLENERMKLDFYAALTQEIQFEYTCSPSSVTLSPFGANKLGFPEVIQNPHQDPGVLALMNPEDLRALATALQSTSPGRPEVIQDCKLNLPEGQRWYRILSRAIWSPDDPPRYTGAIGKAIDIHDSRVRLNDLEQMAFSDPLTGLLNHATAKERIKARLEERPDSHYALVIFDLDHFKLCNDQRGHQFGDQVLIYTAQQLQNSIRSGDIVARVGGDEFLLFLEYKTPLEPIIQRIFTSLQSSFDNSPISISMGVAQTSTVGIDYDTLFRAADQALYSVKRGGRGQYRFYDDSMQEILSAISPIDRDTFSKGEDRT